MSVFISYHSESRDKVDRLLNWLSLLEVDFWYDQKLETGRVFTEDIAKALQSASCVIVCWSQAATLSNWVVGEAEMARSSGRMLPARLEPCDLVAPFNVHQTETLYPWTDERVPTRLHDLMDALGKRLRRDSLGDWSRALARGDAKWVLRLASEYPEDPLSSKAHSLAKDLLLKGGKKLRPWDLLENTRWDHFKTWLYQQAIPLLVLIGAVIGLCFGIVHINARYNEATETTFQTWTATLGREPSPSEIRAYLGAYPKSTDAEDARALLDTRELAAWSEATHANTRQAYIVFLKEFPLEAEPKPSFGKQAVTNLSAINAKKNKKN